MSPLIRIAISNNAQQHNKVTIQHFFRKKAQKTLDMVFRDFLWIHAPVAALH